MDVVAQLKDLLELPEALDIEGLTKSENRLILVIHLKTEQGCCRSCDTLSGVRHGAYWRNPQDRPLSQWTLQLQIRIARFRCLNPQCQRQTFAADLAPCIKRDKRCTLDVLPDAEADTFAHWLKAHPEVQTVS